MTVEDAGSAAEEGAIWGEGHATGGSAQASPPRAAAKLVARGVVLVDVRPVACRSPEQFEASRRKARTSSVSKDCRSASLGWKVLDGLYHFAHSGQRTQHEVDWWGAFAGAA